MAGDKTENASAQQKKKAREQGDIVKSRDLTSALGMAAGVVALGMVAESLPGDWQQIYVTCLRMGIRSDLSLERGAVVNSLLRAGILPAMTALGTVLAATLALALLTGMAQTGGLRFYSETLQPKADRLNPVTNLKNIFSLRSSARLAKSLMPAALVVAVGAHWMERSILSLPVLSLERIPEMFESQYQLLLAASGILLGWSALDYLVEWRSWENRLRMSRDDMREEFKQTEGNPQVRGRIRSIRRQLRNRKLRADVSRATVVITNPTHYAVALDFDFETMQAPKVLAKGRNLFAEQIKEEARWAGVPIVENPPLARSLFRSVEPGQAIPRDLYATVAAILAFLYRQHAEEKMRATELERHRHRPEYPNAGQSASPSEHSISALNPLAQSTYEEMADSSGVIDAIWEEEDGEEEQMKKDGENA